MSAKSQVEKYRAALQRLVDRDQPINNDAVALEAGSGRGSIKKSRPGHALLVREIAAAAHKRSNARISSDRKIKMQSQIAELTQRLDAALEREVALLHELLLLRLELQRVRGGLGRKHLMP